MKLSNWFIFVQGAAVSNSDNIGNGIGYGHNDFTLFLTISRVGGERVI